MDSPPLYLPLLLLTCLLTLWQGAGAQSLFTIDSVTLKLDPSGEVTSGTLMNLNCEVSVSHDQSHPMTHSFNFLRDDVLVYSKNTTESAALHQLNPARAANSGTYKCQVIVQDKSKGSRTHRLTVTGLQTPVLQVTSQILFEGDEVAATCSAPDESGSLLFHFYQDQDKIKQVRAIGNSVGTRLELKHAGDKHLRCYFEITMLPDAGRSNNSNTVKVMVKELFITPVMNILPGKDVIEGDIVEFVCRVVNPPSNVTVFLNKDKRVLKTASISLSHSLRVLAEDSGEYVCKVERGNVQKEAYESIKVKELFSKPVLVMKPREVFETERFTLNCDTALYSHERINIGDVKYSLYRNQVLLTSGGNYSATAHPSLNGNYSCQAQAQGRGQTKKIFKNSTQIVLKAKVPVSVPLLSVVGGRLILGKPFQLQCQSDNGSLPITYTLLSPHRQAEFRVVRRPWDLALFNITSIHRSSDIHSFSCKAKNNPSQPYMESSGDHLRRTATIIEPVSRPVLTLTPKMGDVAEGEDLTLTCTVQRGTPPITYTWYHTKSALPLLSKITNDMRLSHSFQGVSREHGGGYYCVTNNPSNDSQRSAMVTVGVKLAGWKKGLIAAFCILLTVSLIIIILVKKCLLPFRRERTVELSVKPASTKTDETLRLTHGEVNEAANVTPGVMGRSVWSDHVSGSESDDQTSEETTEVPEPQYTEVHPQEVDPTRAPVKKGTDTVYSEVRNSNQGESASEQADGQGSVEYAQLNHNDHESEEPEHEPRPEPEPEPEQGSEQDGQLE
ncbi:platelet endothelial cell adhesion molecule isoform X1 [Oncorhynchus nerka]|uniref:platelet endothelial cell adhesion molecule isoform X1 n=1 Tax=Oncorhynchus nerka TaxID=8023 RepID=UPI001131EA96|nr:platelet endothelial cell adhesion molecule-like isoform X1 [Oncorhynchus nerka]